MLKSNLKKSNKIISAVTRELPVALPLGLSFRRGLMVLCETKRNETVLCETWAVKDRDEVECRLDFRRSVVSGLRPSPRRREKRRLLSRTAAGDRAYVESRRSRVHIRNKHFIWLPNIFAVVFRYWLSALLRYA